MKHLIAVLSLLTLVACGGNGGDAEPGVDTVLDTVDVAAPLDSLPDSPVDTPADTPPDTSPDTPPDLPPELPPGCGEEEHDGGDGACVPLGECSPGFHDDGAGLCVPEGECAHGFSDGGDGSCVPEGTCAEGHHDGGDGACLPMDTCAPGFFNQFDNDVSTCIQEIVVSDPAVGGVLPTVLWDGTGATMLWHGPGEPGKWMKRRMTFDGQLLGEPGVHAMDVAEPGGLVAFPTADGGLLAAWEQSGGILRCMRGQQDGSSTTNTLAVDAQAAPGEALVSMIPEAEGALVAWVSAGGAPTLARVDDACQITWGPEALPLAEAETLLGAPTLAQKDGVTLVGWPANDGAGEGFHRVLAYDDQGLIGEAQAWQDGPGVVEAGLRLVPKALGFGFFGLTLGPFGGGVATPILRDLDGNGIPKASPEAPFPVPPAEVVEPWCVDLGDDGFTVVWVAPETGTLWLAAFGADGAPVLEPLPVTAHGPDAGLTLGPRSMARIPGLGHVLVWSSSLSGQPLIYAAIVDNSGVRLH